ncbi:MAG: M81 family metallopeptidase, partial [Acidobacteria bacterium]|nr:M81 family metallopeptidase [Acidobacteriota bacterium]
FQAAGLLYGQEVLENGATRNTSVGGFLQAIADHGDGEIAVLPILRARAMSGGPVEREVYKRFKRELLDGLAAAPRVDGIYLALHGAMGVEGMRDPEGDLLAAIRSELGPSVPIGISHDLHANVTKARGELATFIVGYKTNPHRDFFRTGYDSGRILAATVLGKIHPVMAVRKMRLLKGGGMNIDFLSPMNRVFRFMSKAEKRKGVLSVSTFPVHLWLDDEELGWTTVAVTDADPQLAAKTADDIADVAWSIRAVPHQKSSTASAAVAAAKMRWLARKTGAIVICDVADAVGAGAPGENTWILKALLEGAPELVSYVPIRDADAVQAVWGKAKGETVTVTVGGKLERRYNRPLEFTGQVVRTSEGALGKTVVLRHQGVHLIVSELPPSATKPRFFTDLGLGVWKADILVVKNLFPFRYSFLAVNRGTLDVETPGTSGVDVFELDYKRIPRPIYPLDPVESWR